MDKRLTRKKRWKRSVQTEQIASQICYQWQDAKNYQRKLTNAGWAWEFLRRNPDYNEDFQQLAIGPCIRNEDASPGAEFWLSIASTTRDLAKVEGVPLGRVLAAKWGMRGTRLLDPQLKPSADDNPEIFAPRERVVIFEQSNEPDHLPSFKSTSQVCVRLDLAYPLVAQFKVARELCDVMQIDLAKRLNRPGMQRVFRTASKVSDDELAQSLRVLDGYLRDIPADEIAKAFGWNEATSNLTDSVKTHVDTKGRDAVKKTLRRAKWLSEYGYRNLLSRPER